MDTWPAAPLTRGPERGRRCGMNGRKAAIATHNGVEDRGAVGEQCAVVLQAAEHHVGVGGMERDARVIHGDGEPGTSARPAVAAVGRSVDAAIGAGPELPRVARINDNGVPIAMDYLAILILWNRH